MSDTIQKYGYRVPAQKLEELERKFRNLFIDNPLGPIRGALADIVKILTSLAANPAQDKNILQSEINAIRNKNGKNRDVADYLTLLLSFDNDFIGFIAGMHKRLISSFKEQSDNPSARTAVYVGSANRNFDVVAGIYEALREHTQNNLESLRADSVSSLNSSQLSALLVLLNKAYNDDTDVNLKLLNESRNYDKVEFSSDFTMQLSYYVFLLDYIDPVPIPHPQKGYKKHTLEQVQTIVRDKLKSHGEAENFITIMIGSKTYKDVNTKNFSKLQNLISHKFSTFNSWSDEDLVAFNNSLKAWIKEGVQPSSIKHRATGLHFSFKSKEEDISALLEALNGLNNKELTLHYVGQISNSVVEALAIRAIHEKGSSARKTEAKQPGGATKKASPSSAGGAAKDVLSYIQNLEFGNKALQNEGSKFKSQAEIFENIINHVYSDKSVALTKELEELLNFQDKDKLKTNSEKIRQLHLNAGDLYLALKQKYKRNSLNNNQAAAYDELNKKLDEYFIGFTKHFSKRITESVQRVYTQSVGNKNAFVKKDVRLLLKSFHIDKFKVVEGYPEEVRKNLNEFTQHFTAMLDKVPNGLTK